MACAVIGTIGVNIYLYGRNQLQELSDSFDSDAVVTAIYDEPINGSKIVDRDLLRAPQYYVLWRNGGLITMYADVGLSLSLLRRVHNKNK